MRNKEVEEAINRTNAFIEENLYRIGGIQGFSIKGGVEKGLKTEQLKTVLAYIEELEKQIPTPSNEVLIEYQTLILVNKRDAVMKSEIRDKIKELEEELKVIQDKLSKNMLFSESEFCSFSEYTKWRIGINQKIKDINAQIEVLKSIIGE